MSPEEIEILLAELKDIRVQVERKEKIRQNLMALRGRGKGIWHKDAQQLVNEMREEQ